MTLLTKPVTRETLKQVGKRAILLTIAPCGSQDEARIGLRLKGKRTQYVVLLSDVWRMAALWHGQKESKARKEARKAGVPWRNAKKQFIRNNSL